MQSRRSFLTRGLPLAALVTGLIGGLPGCSRQQDASRGLVDLLVPTGPGGGWDQTARSLERALMREHLRRRVRISYAPGGGGAVGLARFLDSPARDDGLLVAGMVMIGALAMQNSPVRLLDTTPIARLTGEYEVIAVHRDSPFKSLGDLLNVFTRDPGSVSWAGGAAGGTDHLLVAMIAEETDIPFADVAYVAYAGGGLAQGTLLGNQVSCGVSGYGELAEQIASGQLRALAISAPERLPGLDIPTLREAGIPVELANWRGVFAARALPTERRRALVDLIEQTIETPTWRAELATHRWTDLALTGPEFTDYLALESERITDALRRAGMAAV